MYMLTMFTSWVMMWTFVLHCHCQKNPSFVQTESNWKYLMQTVICD